MDKLKAKRFRQIFDYLDADGAGCLDLTALVKKISVNAFALPRTTGWVLLLFHWTPVDLTVLVSTTL